MRFPERALTIPGHGGAIEDDGERVFLGLGVRNGGQGLAVIHGWRVDVLEGIEQVSVRPDPDSFRRQQLDLFIPAGERGVWLGAVRDRHDDVLRPLRAALTAGERVIIDLLYGDHEGGQRTIARFSLVADEDGERRALVLRYWNLDREDPR